MKFILSIFLCSILLFVGCTPTGQTSSLVTALNVVADASSAVVIVAEGLVALNQITPADAATIASYATAASTAAQNSIAELNSTTDTNVTKIEFITQQFTIVVAPAFGSTASPLIVAAENALSAAVNSFLTQLNLPQTQILARTVSTKTVTMALASSKADQQLLKQIQKTCANTIQQAQTLKGN